MASGKLFIGRKVREIRITSGNTQVQFAEKLGISTSYVNQIESNQRPVSAAVLITLIDKFGLDLSELTTGETDRLASAVTEALSDPLFESYSPTPQELKLITHNAPGFARALVACHQAYRRNSEQLAEMDRDIGHGVSEITPYEEVRDYFHFVDNYVHELDLAAEALAQELKIGDAETEAKLTSFLKSRFGVTVRRSPTMAAIREFDEASRVLTVSANVGSETRLFQIAVCAAQLHADKLIDETVSSAGFRSSEATEICRMGLQNYFAGALLMPYGAFLDTARLLRHDIGLLSVRFGTSFEQVCHRLSTLQRSAAKGVPIFFAKIDRAGNIVKRHSATKLQFARFGAACPLWNAHQAFDGPGRFSRQLAETPDGERYLCLATQVTKGAVGYSLSQPTYALAIGCEIAYADSFVYADTLNFSEGFSFEPIGISCRICPRPNCASRALPPFKHKLSVDHLQRHLTPYRLQGAHADMNFKQK